MSTKRTGYLVAVNVLNISTADNLQETYNDTDNRFPPRPFVRVLD
jgi:hypothetical protein